MRRARATFSGAPWEREAGYCRAIRAGVHIYVTGTAPVAEGGGVHAVGDAYELPLRSGARVYTVCSRSLAPAWRSFTAPNATWRSHARRALNVGSPRASRKPSA